MLFLLLAEPCVASEAKPATPTFTIVEISQPYDVPPSTVTTVDPYTGEENTITYPGYHVENKTVCIKIKNQPFTPIKQETGAYIRLYYQYRYKGHYSEDTWQSIDYDDTRQNCFVQSDTEYTLIPLSNRVPRRGQVDIQVRAVVGIAGFFLDYMAKYEYRFSGVMGDWSDIVVVSFDPLSFSVLPSTSTPSTNSPSQLTPDPINPTTPDSSISPTQTPWITYLLIITTTVCIITVPLVIIMYHNKHYQQKRKPKNTTPTNHNKT